MFRGSHYINWFKFEPYFPTCFLKISFCTTNPLWQFIQNETPMTDWLLGYGPYCWIRDLLFRNGPYYCLRPYCCLRALLLSTNLIVAYGTLLLPTGLIVAYWSYCCQRALLLPTGLIIGIRIYCWIHNSDVMIHNILTPNNSQSRCNFNNSQDSCGLISQTSSLTLISGQKQAGLLWSNITQI